MTSKRAVESNNIVVFRVVNLAHLNLMWPLVVQFYNEVKPKRYTLLDLEYRILQELPNPELGMFTVCTGDKPIAYSICYLAQIVMPVIFICHLYILPEYRFQIGPLKKLYKHMKSWALVNGCRQVMINVMSKELIEMYKGLGFEIDSIQMFREL